LRRALASNFKQQQASRGATRPRICIFVRPRESQRAQGKPGALSTRDRAQKCTRVTARCAGTPGLPCAMVLRLIARSPWRRIPVASIADELTIRRRPVGPDNISISLTPATGARTTRLCRPRLPPPKRFDRLMCCRPKFRRRRLSAVRLRADARSRITALRKPLAPDAAASIAFRTQRP
jgi:hypothetical protein